MMSENRQAVRSYLCVTSEVAHRNSFPKRVRRQFHYSSITELRPDLPTNMQPAVPIVNSCSRLQLHWSQCRKIL